MNKVPLSETKPASDFSYDEFRQNAAKVLKALKSDGFASAVESQIDQQEDRALREQAEVIIHSQAACRLDGLKLRMTARDSIDEAKVALIHYNHALRNLIWNNLGAVLTDDLTGWLTAATKDSRWVVGMVSGATGEVAVARALRDMAGVRDVRLGTVDEDRHGIDVVVSVYNGQVTDDLLAIDVKTRHHLWRRGSFSKLPVTWATGQRYYRCELAIEAQHISAAATLDDRAHRPQLGKLQDYIHELSRHHKAHGSSAAKAFSH